MDNVSVQPFTEEQWRSHQDQRISMVNKALYIRITCLFWDIKMIIFVLMGLEISAGTQEDNPFEYKRCKW